MPPGDTILSKVLHVLLIHGPSETELAFGELLELSVSMSVWATILCAAAAAAAAARVSVIFRAKDVAGAQLFSLASVPILLLSLLVVVLPFLVTVVMPFLGTTLLMVLLGFGRASADTRGAGTFLLSETRTAILTDESDGAGDGVFQSGCNE